MRAVLARTRLYILAGALAGYSVQSFTGYYRLDARKVLALDLNPFASAVSGQSEAQFLGAIARLLAP